jgi:hypothetical protein
MRLPLLRWFALVTVAFFSLAAAGSDPRSNAPGIKPHPVPFNRGTDPGTDASSEDQAHPVTDAGSPDERSIRATDALARLPVPNVNPAVNITVDAGANRHAIDPRIYGLAWATPAQLTDLGATINRWGGNAMSRYNWAFSTANRCKDYYFENIPDNVSSGDGSNGKSADDFIGPTLAAGAQPIMTVPMMGVLPIDRSIRCGYSILKYGAQDASDPFRPDCGNGKSGGNRLLNVNDPADTSATYPASHQANWVQHIVSTFGPASTTGVRYYALDNEPVLWSFDHWDVHPNGSTYDEIWGKMAEYGAAIKGVDPTAQVTGIEEWGWSGYFSSGLDAENQNNGDRLAHGDVPLSEWLLQQARTYEQTNGIRILDIAALHFYPQGDNAGHYEFSNDDSSATQLLRNRSTRSLWDPNYVNESWIGGTGINGGKVRLIPLLREWTNADYPGTKIGVTEYNWGDEGHINGATAQADILGIFGRENLDLGVRWTTPATSSFAYNGFKIYRNYDGSHAHFGDLSVSTIAPDPDNVSAFAALRSSDGALTVMVIAKALSGTTSVTLNLANFTPSAAAQRWQLDSGNAIVHEADVTLAGPSLNIIAPAQSITLLVIQGSYLNAPTGVVVTATSTSATHITWSAVPGALTYQVYRSSLNSAYAAIGSPTAGTTYDDGGLSANTTYLYEVRAMAASISSSLSAPDPATTIIFTDDPVGAGIAVKALHITELRTAVNAMRAAAGLTAQTFTDAAPAGLPVKALHLVQLRTALDQARATIGVAPTVYTDPALTPGITQVKAAHIQALRNGVK